MRLHQVHKLENTSFVPLHTVLPADDEVNNDRVKFAISRDVVQIMLDKSE